MKTIIINILFFFSFVLIFTSCEGDCKDEQIEKVEWVTNYVTKTKDTLVSYSIIENKREFFKAYEEIKHTITIRNNNSQYSNKFAVKFNCGVYDSYYGDQYKSNEYEYVSIEPNSTYTFTYYSQAGKYYNYNSEYTVLQEPVNITYKEIVHNLKKEMTTVNSCNENVEALKEKYKVIKELYQQKLENKSSNGQE
jgi:hypothetical protein